MPPISDYTAAVRRQLATGIAGEHAYRPALQALLQALGGGLTAVNDPARTEAGAPDLILVRNGVPEAYVETKDIGDDLRKTERSKQLRRYLAAFPNLVLTDYLEFRWYADGKLRERAHLGEVDDAGKLRTTLGGAKAVEDLLLAFLAHRAPVAASAKDLAHRMASLAHMTRDATLGVLGSEGEGGQLHGQLDAFRTVLVPALSEDAFADMYAQTIAYGLFAARCHHQPGETFGRRSAAWDLPRTNPFLRSMFGQIAGQDLDDRIAWVVDDLADYLARADMRSILEDFTRRAGREDPVVHFYETFLREYDPKLRELRGVYYTPEPVVSYIVRSVDHLLREEFGRPLGLADPDVCILDPACGTGTFLYFVIQHIHGTVVRRMGGGAWPAYVRENLLGRLFGFELLMAPYTIAHMKLSLLLQDLGYDFADDQRLGIYLTNTLEEAAQKSDVLFGQFIAREANAASEVKRDKPIMVVLGNPPYSGHSDNRGDWIRSLIEDYKRNCHDLRRPGQGKWLQNDYVKFLRFAQWRLQRTGHGVLGFITDNGYLNNATFPGMRASLARDFDHIRVLDLHGDVQKGDRCADGSPDENVFDIQKGVAIGLFARTSDHGRGTCRLGYADLSGTRAGKYEWLSRHDCADTRWVPLESKDPDWSFLPRQEANRDEYGGLHCLPDVMDRNGRPAPGIVTTHDEFAISWGESEAERKVTQLLDTRSEEEARSLFRLCSQSQWDYGRAKRELAEQDWRASIGRVLYRPFDVRWTVYNSHVAVHRRTRVTRHLLLPNLGLIATRQTRDQFGVLASALPVAHKSLARYDINYVFPLYLYPSGQGLGIENGRRANFSPAFIRDVRDRTGLESLEDGVGDLHQNFGPEDAFHFVYAVLHSPVYRERYREFLHTGFPAVPLTSDVGLFRALCGLGRELVELHVMESGLLDEPFAIFEGSGDNTVEWVRYDEAGARVCINDSQHFANITPDVFHFHVGGYQVLDKWLKDRKGRQLSFEDIRHYCRVVAALRETIRLMHEIDAAIPGWPLG